MQSVGDPLNETKLQIPTFKFQRKSNHQAPRGGANHLILELETSLDVGAWNLELFDRLDWVLIVGIADCRS
jgi:hypothetical protein